MTPTPAASCAPGIDPDASPPGPTPGADCYDHEWSWTASYEEEPVPEGLVSCPQEQPCAHVLVERNGCGEETPYDPEAAGCVIDSLRAGERAHHSYRDCREVHGSSNFSVQLDVLGDGTVLFASTTHNDFNIKERAAWRALPDAAYFDACCTATREGFEACLLGILDQECPGAEPVCPP